MNVLDLILFNILTNKLFLFKDYTKGLETLIFNKRTH